jgi:hypothetical protein
MVLSSIFYFNQTGSVSSACKRLKKDVLFEYKTIKKSYDLEGLNQQAWRTCFSVFLPTELDCNTLIMCKLKGEEKESIVFDANIMHVSGKTPKGYKTDMGVVTIAQSDKDRLERDFFV